MISLPPIIEIHVKNGLIETVTNNMQPVRIIDHDTQGNSIDELQMMPNGQHVIVQNFEPAEELTEYTEFAP